MEHHTSDKRRRASSDAETVSEAGTRSKRVQEAFAQPASTVGHAMATGSARMLNGHVHGDNIHGNVSTTINNFHTGSCESSQHDTGPENSGILSASERKELMECLRFPQLDARLTNLRKAESQTCDWIVQRRDYNKWLESDELKACDGFFWIKGNPGTGKSITMKFLYRRLQRQLRNAKTKDKSKNKLVIAFFFNARGNEFEKSTLGLYRSLLFNLFTLEPHLQEALDHCQRSGYYNILESGWQLQMLKEVFEEALILLEAQGKQLYCYVDALDECPEDDVQDMISYFEDLVGKMDSRNFRVCFSSRHYPQISIRTKLTMTLEKERNHEEDIRIFIESQLRFEEDVDADLLQQIRTEILEKSSGVFLWVNLVVHQLNEVQRHDGRITKVQQRLREIPEAVKKRPGPNGAMPLYALFQDIIQKDEKNIDELVRITQIVFCARRPLHPKELYVLLHEAYNVPFDSTEISDKILRKHVLEVSKGLAEVTKSEEPTVQFIHETVTEFLRDGGLGNITMSSVERDGHQVLKASCVKQILAPVSDHLKILAEYWSRGHYRNIKVHEVTRSQQEEFQKQASQEIPFLEYAAKNVLFHADKAEAMGISQTEFLEAFPAAQWIPIYNLFEKFNKRRYSGTTTPVLYILASQGCDYLIKSSMNSRGQYAREIKGNEFPSALACAIYNGNLNTAWTLVGLEPKNRPQNTVAPRRDFRPKESSLIRLLLVLGDVPLMRRVLEDRHTIRDPVIDNIDFELVKSAEMIDLFLEVSVVPGFPLVGCRDKKPPAIQEGPELPQLNTDFLFIRKAIEEQPSLLLTKAWGGRTMFDYAMSHHLQSLVSLYLEYSNGGQSDLDAVLHCAAAKGELSLITFVHERGANLVSQDDNGRTALHLAAEKTGNHHFTITMFEEVLQYVLCKEPSCVNVCDSEGRTPLVIAAHRCSRRHASILETFLQAGADTNTVIECHVCERHNLPLATYFVLAGNEVNFEIVASYDGCNLDARDSLGRTALSWCCASRHGDRWTHYHDSWWQESIGRIGEQLLQRPAVDVNSRDDSGHTVLEHCIRTASLFRHKPQPAFRNFVQMLLESPLLDPNLRMSNHQHPLELIISLYDTWPWEFDDHTPRVDLTRYDGGKEEKQERLTREGNKQAFHQHLVEALELLLRTGKVETDVQRRCAESAAPELRSIILGSIESMS